MAFIQSIFLFGQPKWWQLCYLKSSFWYLHSVFLNSSKEIVLYLLFIVFINGLQKLTNFSLIHIILMSLIWLLNVARSLAECRETLGLVEMVIQRQTVGRFLFVNKSLRAPPWKAYLKSILVFQCDWETNILLWGIVPT